MDGDMFGQHFRKFIGTFTLQNERVVRGEAIGLRTADGISGIGRLRFFWEEWEHGGEECERISVPAAECSRISPQLLAEEQAKGDETFRREYMCEFGEMEGAVFSGESIESWV
jgi:hypothetical protein